MADDLGNPGNVDPWAGFSDAPQPKGRWVTLVPVDHDPFADGGDLSGPSVRRLPGERAVAPRGMALQGPGEFEDPEAAAYARSDAPVPDAAYQKRLMDQINQGRWYNAEGAKGAGAVAAVPLKWAKDAYDAADQLMHRPYEPGTEDEQSVAAGSTASGVAGFGARGISRAIGADTGSLGTFIGKVGAKNLAEAGHPTALKAIAEAERLDALGFLSEDAIRSEVMPLIRAEDPKNLGTIRKGEEGKWHVEVNDSDSRVRPMGPGQSKLGRELNHPYLYMAYPDLPAVGYRRISGGTSYHQPGYPDSEIGVGSGSPSKRASTLHEVQHELQVIEDFARGGSPADFQPGGQFEYLMRPGETPDIAYRRIAGEIEARVVADRYQFSAKERRNKSYDRSVAELKLRNVVPEGPPITRYTGAQGGEPRSLAASKNPDPGEPSAFEHAQEKGWEDLARKGEAGQQSMWSDMGAHLNKPGQRGGGPGKAPSDLWSREANLDLAQMHRRGEWPADISARLSDKFGKRFTEDQVANQLEALGVVGSSRKLPSSAIGEWQPDAMAILQSDRVNGMPAAQIAKLIEQETGQVTTKNSVIGKLNRLRQERQRAELSEDLAKSAAKLRATGVPVPIGDAERRRRSWPIWDRINFWGGY